MNTETLKTFVLLSEIKNYTQTANKLFVAQSTVTNRILELEHELEKVLFIRNKKLLQLTEEGELFLQYAKRILELEDTAKEELIHFEHHEQSIRIGTTNTIYDCHLAAPVLCYMNGSNQCNLNITISHSLPLIQMLQDKILDVAFSYVPFHKNNIICNLFHTDELVLVTSPDNTKWKDGIALKYLPSIPYYYCDFNFQNLGSYIKDLFPKGHAFPFIIDRSANLLPLLETGKGYSFLPRSMVAESLKACRLIEIPLLDFSLPPISCYILYQKLITPEMKVILKDILAITI